MHFIEEATDTYIVQITHKNELFPRIIMSNNIVFIWEPQEALYPSI